MDFAVIVALAVGFFFVVGAAVFWLNQQELEREREASRDAWTALAARREFQLVATPTGHFHITGVAGAVDFTLARVALPYGTYGVRFAAAVPHAGEPEWVVYHAADRPPELSGPRNKVATGD